MIWLLHPVFHEDGRITFKKYKQIRREDAQVIAVHKDLDDLRAFWQGI